MDRRGTGACHADALLIVDVQTAFVSGAEAVPGSPALVRTVRDLLERARAARALVVHLQNDGPSGAADEPGTPGWKLYLPVARTRDELVVRKSADDGFRDTGLAGELRGRGVRSVVICGVLSEMCVGATARTALGLGFGVVLPHDAHGTYDIPESPEFGARVPARVVARVAEWALGDTVRLVPRAVAVGFVAPPQVRSEW